MTSCHTGMTGKIIRIIHRYASGSPTMLEYYTGVTGSQAHLNCLQRWYFKITQDNSVGITVPGWYTTQKAGTQVYLDGFKNHKDRVLIY